MDIAALSMAISQSNVVSSVGVSVAKMAMNQQESAVSELTELMDSAANIAALPSNHILDVTV